MHLLGMELHSREILSQAEKTNHRLLLLQIFFNYILISNFPPKLGLINAYFHLLIDCPNTCTLQRSHKGVEAWKKSFLQKKIHTPPPLPYFFVTYLSEIDLFRSACKNWSICCTNSTLSSFNVKLGCPIMSYILHKTTYSSAKIKTYVQASPNENYYKQLAVDSKWCTSNPSW